MAYTFQAPKVFEEQSAGFKKAHVSVTNLIRKGWQVELKYDGVFSAINTATCVAISRDGNEQAAAGRIVEHYQKTLGEGHYVFGELWVPSTEHRVINGMARRKEVQPLHFRAFDCITVNEFLNSKSGRTHHERKHVLLGTETDLYKPSASFNLADYVDPANFTDKDLSQVAYDLCQWSEGKDAYDGLIIRDPDAIWTPGATKQGEVLKLKGETSLDLRVVGEVVEDRPTKLGGYVTVIYKGVKSNVGSGLTQDQLKAVKEGRYSFVGRVVEVTCLGVNASGALREPRLKGVRHDTLPEEEK